MRCASWRISHGRDPLAFGRNIDGDPAENYFSLLSYRTHNTSTLLTIYSHLHPLCSTNNSLVSATYQDHFPLWIRSGRIYNYSQVIH
jgi:hypothetical protein